MTITFTRLTDIPLSDIVTHMSDPRLLDHMPLLSGDWTEERAEEFVLFKEGFWTRDGLGHWAILADGDYVGWGGFQKEGEEWDFGLVLTPGHFGLGTRITAKALDFARADDRIPYVTFLLPPTRTKLAALKRLGAVYVGDIDYDGETFMKFRLDTPPNPA